MKTTTKRIILASALIIAGIAQANAFYDPHMGRWASRDPIGELGFRELSSAPVNAPSENNLFLFVDNSPVSKIDFLGLYAFKGCNANQEGMIRNSVSAFCAKAKGCAPSCSLGAITLAIRKLCDDPNNAKPTFICIDDSFEFSDGEKCKDNLCGRGYSGTQEIFLCPKMFDPREQNRFGCPRDCVLFHEAIHTFGVLHGPDMTTFDNCMGCTPQPETK